MTEKGDQREEEESGENRDKRKSEATIPYRDHMTEIVRKAEQDGHFDDLPGKGQPLPYDRDYANPPEKRIYKTMKDNHVLPRWIELAKEIDQLKAALETTAYDKQRRKQVKEINKKIKSYNGLCPPPLQKNKLREK